MGEPVDYPVCLVLRYFTVGGLERVVSTLANGLVERGVPVRVVILGTAKRNALITELDERVESYILDGSWLCRLRRLRTLTAGHLVHLHFGDGKIHPSVRCALWDHPRVVVTYHSVYSHLRNRADNAIDRLVSRRSRNVIAVSKAVSRFCVNEVGLPESLVTVINNAVPTAIPVAFTHIREPGLWLMDVAGVYPHKNHITLIRGLAILRSRGYDVRLRIIGDGPEMGKLFQEANRLRITAYVDWYGAVWRREIVYPLLRASDVFVSASRFEGTPLTVLEAMQVGLPLVLSDIPAHRETAGNAADFFAVDDAREFAKRVEPLLDEEVRAARADIAQCRSKEFSVDRFIDGHLRVYRSPVAGFVSARGE